MPVTIYQRDSTALGFADASYDQVIVFFLLHEQPEKARRETLREAIRVTKPGGKVVLVDYHGPHALHPLRYVFQPILRLLEPFAIDLWRTPQHVAAGDKYCPRNSGRKRTSAACIRRSS